ncbi:DUF616 domain-containing protein [Gammaproteobacteria bacterium LSUCC0057]|uniref:DUF616 domain-containing protein n=1 Tax=Gammaproteobacteria bacterium LSUCC0057 TaxID=2559237 RepID=A0A4Y8UJI7_9GAMM|nr:DUF616 domain-containing protein [Gammaproteobacteria bacterium LSUCC0057]
MQTVVYTALIGGYEQLNEQPMAKQSSLRFVCFSDDATLQSDSWEIVHVEPYLPEDLSRSQRYLKLLPHRHFSDYQRSLYIDNTVVLKKPPEEIIADHHQGPFTNFEHSYRSELIEEFIKVLQYGIDDPGRVYEQLNQLQTFSPQLLSAKVFWGGFMIRDHHQPQMVALAEQWWAQVLRYSRRDQLSLPRAMDASGVVANALKLSNKDSDFHQWPVAIARKRSAEQFSAHRNLKPQSLQIAELSAELERSRKALNNLPKTVFYRLRDKLLLRGK